MVVEISKEEIERLKGWIEANDMKVFTIIRHVARSGMQREISVVIPVQDSITSGIRFIHPSYMVSQILKRRYTEKHGHNAIICGGCGMDMGFELVYALSSALYGDGYKIRQEWI